MKTELYLEKEATIIFCKVTYALRATVNEELQILQVEGNIKPVANNKWDVSIMRKSVYVTSLK